MGKLASAPVVDISRGAKLDLRASQRRDRLVGRPLPLRAVAGLRLWRQTVARDTARGSGHRNVCASGAAVAARALSKPATNEKGDVLL